MRNLLENTFMKTSRRPFRRMAHRAFARTVATRPLVMQKYGQYSMFYTHDGNKNVSELVFFQQANGIAAHYEYAPFGEVIFTTSETPIATIDIIKLNPYGFSSEYFDRSISMFYYNFREYNPIFGQWVSRDLLLEESNVYLFIKNSALNYYDELGLKKGGYRSARNSNRQGHHTLKNGGNSEKHTRANGFSGNWKPNYKYTDRRGRTILPPSKKGGTDVRVPISLSAADVGILLGGLSIKALEGTSFFDETVDWTYSYDGLTDCLPPKQIQLVEVGVTLRLAEAHVQGPFWGALTPDIDVNYEFEKSMSFSFSCCCPGLAGEPTVTEKIFEEPVSYSWLYGMFGHSDGIARVIKYRIVFPCK